MSLPFQEPDLTRMGASFSPLPALEQLSDLARQARQIHGIDSQFGLRLSRVFQDAGLSAPEPTCDAFIGTSSG
jgi:hypothetical protein